MHRTQDIQLFALLWSHCHVIFFYLERDKTEPNAMYSITVLCVDIQDCVIFAFWICCLIKNTICNGVLQWQIFIVDTNFIYVLVF